MAQYSILLEVGREKKINKETSGGDKCYEEKTVHVTEKAVWMALLLGSQGRPLCGENI